MSEKGSGQVSLDAIKELREKTGLGIMDCKKALAECNGNLQAALEKLKAKGVALAEKKAERALGAGLVESYVHAGGRVAAIVEVNCETDFVARTPEFKALAHDIAMQVAAMDPKCVTPQEVSEGKNPQEVCLLSQPFIKDPKKTIQDIIVEVVAKVRENVGVRRFCRFELGA